MFGVWKIVFILNITFVAHLRGLKIFEFPSSLEDESKVLITNDLRFVEKFTLCLDFYTRLDTRRRLLRSRDPSDLDIYIEEGGSVIWVKVVGIWYMALPQNPDFVRNLVWESLCVSFDSENHNVKVAFRNRIIVAEENILKGQKVSEDILTGLSLGEKDDRHRFSGYITRVNIWGEELDEETMTNITNCGYSHYNEIPDILEWDNVKTAIAGEIFEESVDEYPCTSGYTTTTSVLMPDSADSMFEAVQTCQVLGGHLHFPFQQEDFAPFFEDVKSKLEGSECGSYVWSNYIKNEYAMNNWTVYESEETVFVPPFKPAGWMRWAVGQPNGQHLQLCAGVELAQQEENLFFDLDCEEAGFCYVCRYRLMSLHSGYKVMIV